MSSGASTTQVVTGALGTLIGYLGAEAATSDIFERLLWPQRFLSYRRTWQLIPSALFMPMGCPLHHAALKTFDIALTHQLFRGPNRGHMLGTAFFQDTGLGYYVHEASESTVGKKQARNCLWTRAIHQLCESSTQVAAQMAKSDVEANACLQSKVVRSNIFVTILKLTAIERSRVCHHTDHTVRDSASSPFAIFLMICWTELTGIITGTIVLSVLESEYGLMWFVPVVFKLLSAMCSVPREGLCTPHKDSTIGAVKRYEIELETYGFLILEGGDDIVLQFFRHYGHPIRTRWREIVQCCIIALFGFHFFVGLLCSVFWMPIQVQYVWLGYQLYGTFALLVYRYAGGHTWLTVDAAMATTLANHGKVLLADDTGSAVLATLQQHSTGSYAEAREIVRHLLQ